MYIKGLFETFRILGRLGIKPKDVIGLGGDVVKMGKSLFNTRVNPKLLQFIEKNQKIPTKILEQIKMHARTLKNATENQKKLFEVNIKDILNAKTVKPPVTSVKKQVTSDKGLEIIKKVARKEKLKENIKKGDNTLPTEIASEGHAGSIAGRVQDVTGKTVSQLNKFIKSEKQLLKILDDWDYGAAMTKQSFKKPTEKVIEKVIDFKGWTPKVIKGGKDKLADGGITRLPFSDGSDEIGPQLPDDGKISLDDIVAKVVGPKEDRPDSELENRSAGPMAAPMRGQRGIQQLTKSNVEEKANDIFKGMLYVAKNSDKETVNTLYSAFDGVLDFNIKNQATGVETDLANKLVAGVFDINEGVPTRIDENTVFDIALQTYDLLPNDLKAEINLSSNLAKDQNWDALLEGNNLGIEYNSDNQKIEGYYNIELDSETLKPTIIKPMFEKDNINDEITKSIFIGHGDFPPRYEDFADMPNGAELYQRAMAAWEADKSNEFFGIDLVSKPESDYKGARGTFTTENVSGWGAVESSPTDNLAYIEGTGTIPNYLLKDQKPIELSGSYYQDLDTDDKETTIRADVPLPFGVTPYYGITQGDWNDATEYGINLDKSGKLGNLDYNIAGNIDQDKDYKLQADIGTDNVGIGGWYDADGNWHAGIQAKWQWGEPEEKKRSSSFTTSDPEEAWSYSKKKLFAKGGIANHFRKR